MSIHYINSHSSLSLFDWWWGWRLSLLPLRASLSWLSKPRWLFLERTRDDHGTKRESPVDPSLLLFVLLLCMPQRLYQPPALINACLWDTALKLSLSRSPPFVLFTVCVCVCVYRLLSPPPRWLILILRSAPLIWQDKVEQAGARQDRGMLHGAIKVSFFTSFINRS